MPKGVPDRCDPPQESPLLTGWTNPSPVVTTTTLAPVEKEGISLPGSGILCDVPPPTTEPPNEEFRACRLYSVVALYNNTRQAIVEGVSCTTRQVERFSLSPGDCVFISSLLPIEIVDPGFGSTDQAPGTHTGSGSDSGSGSGSGSGDNGDDNDGDDNENEEDTNDTPTSDELSITNDSDGDGVPDQGVVINPQDCVVTDPDIGDDNTIDPESPEGGGETENGAASGILLSDAGTGGGTTGQPPASGTDGNGFVAVGPQASGMFCFDRHVYWFDDHLIFPPSGHVVKLALVGAGNTEDFLVFDADEVPLESTWRPNAVYVYKDLPSEEDISSDKLTYSSYVVDKEIPTEFSSSGTYSYQKVRESAFNAPRQVATQKNLYEDPATLTLLWDNYRNEKMVGRPSYVILESTIYDTADEMYRPRYTVLFSDLYQSVNSSKWSLQEIDTPDNVENPDERIFRYRINNLSFDRTSNPSPFQQLVANIPKGKASIIDECEIKCPEFFSWHVNSGVPGGYGWDSGTYRLLETNDNWIAQTSTRFEHKIIPILFDDMGIMLDSSRILLNSEDEWLARNSENEADINADLEFRGSKVRQMVLDGHRTEGDPIFLEVVTCTSETYLNSYRPDGTHFIYGDGNDDQRLFPKKITSIQQKRDLFWFTPSGNFLNARDLYEGEPIQLVSDEPRNPYKWYRDYVIPDESIRINGCYEDEEDTLTNLTQNDIDLDYWHTDFNSVQVLLPSGHPYSSNWLSGHSYCQPFSMSKTNVMNNYEEFTSLGSGYVPVNFYPCTITAKIGAMANVYRSLNWPQDDSLNPEVTTTLSPDNDNINVTMGLWSDPRGCYVLNELGTINGKKVWDYVSDIEYEPGLPVTFRIYHDGVQWKMIDYSDYGTVYSTSSTNSEVPLGGWSNNYELNLGCE